MTFAAIDAARLLQALITIDMFIADIKTPVIGVVCLYRNMMATFHCARVMCDIKIFISVIISRYDSERRYKGEQRRMLICMEYAEAVHGDERDDDKRKEERKQLVT